jgi:hypothetical protein
MTLRQSFGGLTFITSRKTSSGETANFNGSFAHAGSLGLVWALGMADWTAKIITSQR